MRGGEEMGSDGMWRAPQSPDHTFSPSWTGMVCDQMVMRDGGGDACGLPASAHRATCTATAVPLIATGKEPHHHICELSANHEDEVDEDFHYCPICDYWWWEKPGAQDG